MALIDVGGLKDSDGEVFKPLPPAQYPVRIASVVVGETGPQSKNPGSPILKLTVKVSEGEHQDRILFENMLLPDKSHMDAGQIAQCVARIKRLLNACGIEVEVDKLDTDELMGAEYLAVVNIKDNRNQITDQLKLS